MKQECLSEMVRQHLEGYFQAHASGIPPNGLYDRILQEIERPLIEHTLCAVCGNQMKAAEVLGINRNTLRKKIKILNIDLKTVLKE
jgi:two-component system nitrogen regulation response regulator GlnG